MQKLAIVAAVIVPLVSHWVYMKKVRGMQLSIFSAGLAVLAVGQFALVELDLGAFSLRAPAGLALLVFCLFSFVRRPPERLPWMYACLFVVPSCLFFTFSTVFPQNEISMFSAISRYGIPISILLSFLFCTVDDAKYVVFTLFAFVAVSSLVGLLQFAEWTPAHRLHQILRPFQDLNSFERSGSEFATAGNFYISGLSSFSIEFTYMTVTVGAFGLAYFLGGEKRGLKCVAGILFVIMLCATVLAKSRSATIGMVFQVIVLLLLARARQSFRANVLSATFIGVALAALIMLFVLSIDFDKFARMTELYDSVRLDLALAALNMIFLDPFNVIGGVAFEARYGILPHNTFLNAGVYYGTLGVLVVSGYFVGCLFLVYRSINLVWPMELWWLSVGSLAGLVGYLWNGLTHNDSIVTGGPLGMFVGGVLIVCLRSVGSRWGWSGTGLPRG